jgi:hypothetical protein
LFASSQQEYDDGASSDTVSIRRLLRRRVDTSAQRLKQLHPVGAPRAMELDAVCVARQPSRLAL